MHTLKQIIKGNSKLGSFFTIDLIVHRIHGSKLMQLMRWLPGVIDQTPMGVFLGRAEGETGNVG